MPIAADGPERVLTKPIFTLSAAFAEGAAASAARASASAEQRRAKGRTGEEWVVDTAMAFMVVRGPSKIEASKRERRRRLAWSRSPHNAGDYALTGAPDGAPGSDQGPAWALRVGRTRGPRVLSVLTASASA